MFRPKPGDVIRLFGDGYAVQPHPARPRFAFAADGRKGTVVQVGHDGTLHALKVFLAAFRDQEAASAARLAGLAEWRGLGAAKRQVVWDDDSVLQAYPDLRRAVLMPWVEGKTWNDVLMTARTAAPYPEETGAELAYSLFRILARLEAEGYAHTDVSAGNVIVDLERSEVSLIDLEDVYHAQWPQPGAVPRGTEGYQHRESRAHPAGQWRAKGDRFAGAILGVEMLALGVYRLRSLAQGETFFSQAELQDETSQRYQAVRSYLAQRRPAVAGLLARAWKSPLLAKCPWLVEWADGLRGDDAVEVTEEPPAPPPTGANPPTGQNQPVAAVARPAGLDPSYELPAGDRDQHGHPVVTRDGSRTDRQTGLPYEVWWQLPGGKRMEFVLIPAGEFKMGSPDGEGSADEHPRHLVRITRPFYLAKYEVTQVQWQAVMGVNPSHFLASGLTAPVDTVSWDDCRMFCGGYGGLRLPTEAEWEYACRAGTTGAIPGSSLDGIAWHSGNSDGTTHPVGKKLPNAWGLYDMIGNVWEWCQDAYDASFYGEPAARGPDPVGAGSSIRVVRGGSWFYDAWYCRSAYRYRFVPGIGNRIVGFRPARPLR